MTPPHPASPDGIVALEIPPPDPVSVYAQLAHLPRPFLLDGGAADATRARYSYVGADPQTWVECADGLVTVDGRPVEGDALGTLDALLRAGRNRLGAAPAGELPPFRGGAVGFLGYELGGQLEALPTPRAEGIALPDMAVGIYDRVVAIDHAAGRAWIFSARRADAEEWRELLAAVGPAVPAREGPWLATPGWRAGWSRADHEAAVARTVDYIAAGDIYQANITQRFLGTLAPGVTPLDLYVRLRTRAAAPFSALLDLGPKGGDARAVVSVSPERFLAVDAEGWVETRPIKGTRPRDADPARDAALAVELLASAKDRAENLMIVDLMRNDLSRVAVVGSVTVPTLCGLESYRTVHHLVSVVTARLAPGVGAVDLLRATFPGGSITGAPKIRAMEIIHELEPARRGPYCGSVLWLGWDGAMDSSIIIRTLAMAAGQVVVQAGGGIVADSDPAAEYEESLVKARALLTALDPAMAWPPPGAMAGPEPGSEAA
ncbi:MULTISPECIES: aminodeoxychorismate synthase component I [Nitrospirillum]|uniref:aminodeoxychorismate synthase n=1 Tax=Nitrospirillum amazonense TaxID=28077 RepID=A0A560FRU1_9PROT|nr:aminodeoxychorismate synthase component I [Nitrospirillum amazonense]MEC4593744.1 aminodeoxychorismate synthase component I [Nitrospirillum amazonense]TWB24293.1 aminodeoxychorismate synthase subunit I [Nitrospirillum amazonense]